jgi:hypothetical protein
MSKVSNVVWFVVVALLCVGAGISRAQPVKTEVASGLKDGRDSASKAFVVQTETEAAFEHNAAVFRPGMLAAELAQHFGEPELKKRYAATRTLWAYPRQGFSAMVADDGRVRYLSINVTDYGVLGGPADVRSDKQIKVGSTIDDVVRAHGKPSRREQFTHDKKEREELEYEIHNRFVTFIFEANVLTQIALSLPQDEPDQPAAKDALQAPRPASRKFVIRTGEPLGFTNAEQRYRLNMKADEFQRSFGPPEKKERLPDGSEQWDYMNDGLLITVGGDKVVKMEFALHRRLRVRADAQTDQGIVAKSSVRELVKAHGEPTKRDEGPVQKLHVLLLRYKIGDQEVMYSFVEGELASILLHTPAP